MPLMAAYEQNDARDAARLLATMTLEGLRDDRHDALVGNAINNMYRLLQGYRAHGFYGYVEEQRSEEDTSMTSLLTSSDRNVGDLKHALDATFGSVFEGQDPGQAIEDMKVVLRMTAYPREGETPDTAEVARAETFFSTLVDKLEA
jgi:hypothetical protein